MPDLSLVEVSRTLEMLVYFLLNIARISQLHHYAKSLTFVVEKGLAIVDDVGVVDGSKDSDLIEGVLFLLLFHLSDLDLGDNRITFFMA